ncbi:MAG: chemotaxis protein CheX [Planctomycetes bacterium]|nr:chemotaxis protein CheX [Planctomycetota bacterium]
MEPTNPPATTKPRDLTDVVSEVLGNLAFMVGDDEDAVLPAGAVWLQCEITYRGPFSGTLTCWSTRDFAVELAANLLGIDRDEGEAHGGAEDALREFMNVLCGQLVTAWHGTEAVFTLSIPSLCECAETPPATDGADECRCQLSVGDEPFVCTHRREA